MALALVAPGAHAGNLLAGTDKVAITPDPTDFPIAAPHEKDFVGIHDQVFARAIALGDGRNRFVLIDLEVTRIPGDLATVRIVAQALGLPASHVLLMASHTHSNPLVFYHGGTPSPVQQRLIERTLGGAIAAGRAALATLQPARIGFARGEAFVNINNGELAGTAGRPDPHGPSDKRLNVLKFETTDHQPLALLVNYATHAQVMLRSVTRNKGYEVSGDLPGATMQLLEASGVPLVFWAPAAEADQLPLFVSLQPASGNPPAFDEGAGGWALLDVQARRLVQAVNDTLAQMAPTTSDATIVADTGSATCPGQDWLRDPVTYVARPNPAPRGDVTIPLTWLRINDIALAGIGGDVAGTIGDQITSALREPRALVMTAMAGEIGYVLPDQAYAKPGHGVYGSHLKPGCAATALVRAFRRIDDGGPK